MNNLNTCTALEVQHRYLYNTPNVYLTDRTIEYNENTARVYHSNKWYDVYIPTIKCVYQVVEVSGIWFNSFEFSSLNWELWKGNMHETIAVVHYSFMNDTRGNLYRIVRTTGKMTNSIGYLASVVIDPE